MLTVFQNRRWDGDFLTVRKLLAGEALGTVTRFESRFERWSPEISKAWKARATAADGGGVLFDLGTHLIDQALLLFGPATVAHAELQARRPHEQVDDDVFLVLDHESGVTSHLSMNMLCAQQGPRFRILGSTGALHQARDRPAGTVHRGRRQPAGRRSTASRRRNGPASWAATATWTALPTERGAYPEFYRILADKILDGGTASSLPLPVNPADAVEVLKLIEKARELARA